MFTYILIYVYVYIANGKLQDLHVLPTDTLESFRDNIKATYNWIKKNEKKKKIKNKTIIGYMKVQ